jgi:hypothetical protein
MSVLALTLSEPASGNNDDPRTTLVDGVHQRDMVDLAQAFTICLLAMHGGHITDYRR